MLNRSDILTALLRAGITNWADTTIADEFYLCPTHRWINQIFVPAWKKNLVSLGLTQWEQDAWDCEDISEEGKSMIKKCHALSVEERQGRHAGIAMGTMFYMPQWAGGKMGHAIAWAIVNEETLAVVFVELQIPKGYTEPRGIITLSKTELNSCYGQFV